MKKYYFLFIVSFLIFTGAIVFATSKEDIVFPVAELGNCESEEDCGVYCDDPENREQCLDFAESHNLIPDEEIAIARKMLAAGEKDGPGGCSGQAECDTYCDNISHLSECLAFAEKYDLMPPDELAEAKKVAKALEQGFTPPNNCQSKEECDVYCSQPANMKECITFAKVAGLMPPEELEEAEKVLAAIEKGVTPPPCGNRNTCDTYCSEPEHLDECITFAEAAGFMSAEEAAMVRRTGGKGPGDCRGKDECEAYCEDPAHGEACINFAIENGFMSPEEAEQAKKMLAAGFTSGPGGCKGQEECEGYCDDISHMTECVDFAEKAGFMSPEDAARARKMAEIGMTGGPGGCNSEEECRAFCEDPTNLDTCINFAVKIGDMTPEEAEQARQGMGQMQEMEQRLKECLVMPCSEAFTCLQSIQGEPGEGAQPEGGDGPGGGGAMGISAEIQAKIESCMQEMMPEGGMPEGMPPEGFEGQEFERQYQEQYQQQYQQQMEQQIQQQIQQQIEELSSQEEIGVSKQFCLENPTDPLCVGYEQAQISSEYCATNPTDPLCGGQQLPFLEQVKNFLAGLIPAI